MAAQSEQNFKNHAKFDPPFHFFLAPVTLIGVVWSIKNVLGHASTNSVGHLIVAITAFVAVFKMRIYSLKVQDRVIRLEERLRMATVLPEPLRARIGELTEAQLIGLRFASDGELPALVEKTLAGNLGTKQIKQLVQHWRADHFRV